MFRCPLYLTEPYRPKFKIPHTYEFVESSNSKEFLHTVLEEGIYQATTLTEIETVSRETHVFSQKETRYTLDELFIKNYCIKLRSKVMTDLKRYNEYCLDRCDDTSCLSISHTIIWDPLFDIELKPHGRCCRIAIAHVTLLSEAEPVRSYIRKPVRSFICEPVSALSLSFPPHTERIQDDNRDRTPLKLIIRQPRHWPRDLMPYDPKYKNMEFLISVATLCVGYMVIAKEMDFHMDCHNTNECCSASHFSVEKLVVACTIYGIGSSNNCSFDIIRENACKLPSEYRCAGLICIAYELQNASSDLHKLIKEFDEFHRRSPLEKLVQILKDPGLTDRASKFKTDSTYESFELSFTFATKIFNVHLPFKRCRAKLPRIWDMENDELIPYMEDAFEIVGFISHVWKTKEEVEKTGKEVTYEDCHNGKVPSNDNKLKAIKNQLLPVCRYWWMDTLCINKADLAELDMSIRSMHSWYSQASIVAVPSNQDLDVWMSRGWCLQECQAARALLIETSNLPKGGIEMLNSLLKMGCIKGDMPANFWLSTMVKRQTTRIEDKAYSLIGLLGIDFQIMYGEGERAWTRLIEQLAIQKGDLSWMVGRSNEVHKTSKCFIPYYIQDLYIAPQITKYPVRVSHVGMELYVHVANNDYQPYGKALKVFGTDIVLYVKQHDDMICTILEVEFASHMNFKSKVQPLWLRPKKRG